MARSFCDREYICGGTRSGATTAFGCRSNVTTRASPVVLARVGDRLPDDLLVAEMNAVEHADGQADPAAAVAQIVRGMDELHWGCVKALKR